MMFEVGVQGPEDSGALEVVAELSGECCCLLWWKAVLLNYGEVGLALPKSSGMGGSIRDIFHLDD